jgi:hypothetical protein
MAMRRLNWLAGLLVPAAILLSGCEPLDAAGGGTTNEAGIDSATATPGCAQPGPKVGHWLPVLDSSNERQATIATQENPCLPFSELLGIIDDVIPEGEVPEPAAGSVSDFRRNVGEVARRFLGYSDAVECGYETDGLAIVVYQHADNPWSVGLVVVVRVSADAVLDAGLCYLGRQIGVPGLSPRSGGNQIQPSFCGLAALSEADDEHYAVVALGTSNWMCGALRTSPAELVEVL